MNLLHGSPGPEPPKAIFAVIEVPSKGKNRYEYDLKKEAFVLEKVLEGTYTYPLDCGFIPSTWYDDSAPLDVMVLVFEPTFPGCIIKCRPIGLLRIKHSSGIDDRILAIPMDERRFGGIKDIDDVPAHTKKEIAHFFTELMKLGGEWCELLGWEGRSEAERAIQHAINLYNRKYGR